MAFFKKKEKKEKTEEVPRLPDLPKLPELPEFQETENEVPGFQKFGEKENFSSENVPELPTFPSGSLGNRFSQNTIKEAVSGEGIEDDDPMFPQEEEFEEREKPRKPLVKEEERIRKPFVREEKRERDISKVRAEDEEEEPIFVRIDRFEDGSKEFDEVKRKVAHIENMLDDIKRVKEKEDKELENWKEEILSVKEKIEKIDADIFSKLD